MSIILTQSHELTGVHRFKNELRLASTDTDNDFTVVTLTPEEAYKLAALLTQVASDIKREGE